MAKGFRVHLQNWGGNGKVNSRANYVNLARRIFDKRFIAIQSIQLKGELAIYNPQINKEQHKGDVADAFLHALWRILGGIKFLKRIDRAEVKKIRKRSVALY